MELTAGICPAELAGAWYAASPGRLRVELEGYVSETSAEPKRGRPRALIVPHAGLRFSGPCAGRAYAAVRDTTGIERIVVLAPSHRSLFRGVAFGLFSGHATPLGDIETDASALAALTGSHSLIVEHSSAFPGENALELQLPFIKTVLPSVRVVPLLCQGMHYADVCAVAPVLASQLWREDTLWVVSSDFTHFGRSFGYVPFERDVPTRLRELDEGAIDLIVKMDAAGLLEYVDSTGATICGALPIAVLLGMLECVGGDLHCELLEYTTSGQLTQDFSHSVSYASLLVTDLDVCADGDAECSGAGDYSLSPAERETLLSLARSAIVASLSAEEFALPCPADLSATLREYGACFVTLHIGERLRGCIGHLTATEPLFENVVRNARNAAFRDHRFNRLTARELGAIAIEISVLTPSIPIGTAEEFVVGRHGIVLEKGRHRAVFLPQVAPEQGWDRQTTLQHLCLKAGLRPDDWRRGAQLSVFEALVFGEEPDEAMNPES